MHSNSPYVILLYKKYSITNCLILVIKQFCKIQQSYYNGIIFNYPVGYYISTQYTTLIVYTNKYIVYIYFCKIVNVILGYLNWTDVRVIWIVITRHRRHLFKTLCCSLCWKHNTSGFIKCCTQCKMY